MNKGFTLVELLIVIVIVGILVTIALPKYNAALERGRAQVALANLRAASDLINAHYVLNGNTYDRTSLVRSEAGREEEFAVTENFTRDTYFSTPRWLTTGDGSSCPQKITTQRDGGDYTLSACNSEGELKYIECVASVPTDCSDIGIEADSHDNYRMYLEP